MKFKLCKRLSVFGIPCYELLDENDNHIATIIGDECENESLIVRIRMKGVIVFGMRKNDVEVIE